jgi:DNA transformation protein and related proteins
MAKRNEFVEHIVETMRSFGRVVVKAMFGGWGLYHRGAFFALIAGDALYLKLGDENRPRFAARSLEAFVYSMKDGTKLTMNYHQVPEEALESPPDMAEWARLGYGAARRAAAKKGVKAKTETMKTAVPKKRTAPKKVTAFEKRR